MSLWKRATRVLAQPQQEWQVIATEATTTAALYRGYIVPLAAIGPLAWLVRTSAFGVLLASGYLVMYRVPFATALTGGLVRYVLGLIGVYVLALFIDVLAPTFGGQRNRMQALKLAAYSSTAAWVAGIVVIPALGITWAGGSYGLVPTSGILGLLLATHGVYALLAAYGLYMLSVGLPVLMKAPPDKVSEYRMVVVTWAVAIFFVIEVISARFMSGLIMPALGGQG